ncbi:hypothetical protein KII95_08595 [Leuconostoc gelidum subsp. aenigmaticum]|uniref:Uncharacterized protein n=2 Tax=Leuconostoc TaxID=1243 RepID=A0ABM9V475_9LACO|nr:MULTISPECIES: hypothetical protein [Leuconostoc]MBZ6004066.1 hypothetical protein [Leuconostoc gelidum subsp. aenigmaticum]MBZ6015431.1 hypothetical protein [Leuconostoc gelidum subsp. gelidum]CUW12528.1 hypothetical protein KSL4_0845 [Leuconostoc inhae]
MLEIKNPQKVDLYLNYDPEKFGPITSIDDIIDVYLQTNLGIVHIGASKEITEQQKQEVVDYVNNNLADRMDDLLSDQN